MASSSVSVAPVPPSRRPLWPLLGWTYLFTLAGFPLHEAAHALAYSLQGIAFTASLNHATPEHSTAPGLLAGPLATLLLAWLGAWWATSGRFQPAPGYGLALGQLLNRIPLYVAMLGFGLGGNDETVAAGLLGVHQAVVIVPFLALFVGTLVWMARRLRPAGYPYWMLGPAFLTVVGGILTILSLDRVLFGR